MSTRSIICKKNSDGTYTGIYCHWDGYVENNGRILNDNYTTEESIDRLLALGDLSSLGKTPEDPGDLWERERRAFCTVPLSRDDPEYVEYWNLMDEYCKSYRSRGETGIDAGRTRTCATCESTARHTPMSGTTSTDGGSPATTIRSGRA